MNNLPKNWYASKTVWASLLTTVYPLFLVLAKQFGWTVPDADSLAGVLSAAGTVAAALVAVWGRVTAKAPIATPSTPKAVPALLLFVLAASILAGCTAAQIAATNAKIVTYSTLVQQKCDALLPLANLVGAVVAPVAQAASLATNACGSAEAIGKMAADPTSVSWLASLETTLATGGTVVAPPVAPAK